MHTRLAPGFRILALAALLTLLTLLAACGRDNIKEGVAEVGQTPPQYDLVVLADKDSQVELDGATLNAEDLRGHIRYRNETGHPVHTILLKKGEKQKVTEQHILVVAGIARDLKAEGFVELNDGKLKRLIVNDTK